MEGFDADVGSFQTALQQRPEIFDPIGVHVPAHVLFGMVDHLMNVFSIESGIGNPRIAENVRTTFDVFADHALKCLALGVGNVAQSNLFRLAIQQAHDDCFTSPARTRDLCLFVLVHESGEAADKRFVYLKLASHFFKCAILHRLADSMQQEPTRLLCDAQVAGDLTRANAVLAIGDQPDRGEPLVQPDGRILEDGSDLGAELLLRMFGLALPDAAGRQQGDFRAPARRASNLAVRPAHRNCRAQAIVRIREVGDRFVKRGRDVRVHASKNSANGVVSQVYTCPILLSGADRRRQRIEIPKVSLAQSRQLFD
jgi:hypothetical protein